LKRCKTCVETDTRPSSKFDEEGICLPCRSVSTISIENIDWQKRNEELSEIKKWAKDRANFGYDCIIGVSGGKDSTRQAIYARELGFNPLLVSCTYPPEQLTERGAYNLANLINLGFDLIQVAPAPKISKKLMLNCFETYGNLFNASELALYASLPIAAIAYSIPLILLGENPALAFGTDVGSKDFNGNNMKHMNTLQGGDPNRFKTDDMTDKDLYWYRYPDDTDMERANLRIVYLGYFMPDFNEQTNSKIAIEHGLKIREGEDADPNNIGGEAPYTALDDDFVIVNQMLKYLKFGFGKATQEVGVAVRFGIKSREEGKKTVKAYDGKCHEKYIKHLADYLEISIDEFWNIADKFVNHELFEKDKDGKWVMKEGVDVW
jgi:N-acetyl sugar amidotransferase